ncbi:phage antirepressor [Lactococcus formosensis]|uniref:phage antirepressor n=1 Tax=Lactococcus formosensis TaxID=1281486 RepID=UPI0024357FB8|nr:phage antirepressor [Lactococcus formosensis]MDG6113787.1 phage antirepressor [Lactococcus formosensis]MDG6122222.1 phage antirepressor [Lactococcus formosensis]MDG6151828.1 phage antirepressor [Lactococcus formosensis]MDG6174952.1 phage antirepressor [Lactococcus formosensis]MDG6181270.1 phage antirepressor [Lactococcus formosensis]
MNQLQNFNFNGNQLRTVLIDNEPFFVGKDAAAAIGYSNTRKAIKDHVKSKYLRESRIVTPSGAQKVTVISEPGLYQLAGESKLPSAEPFQDWVYEEVLPTIRKHGAYMTDAKAQDVLSGNGLADLLLQAGNQIKQLESEKEAMKIELEEATERTRYLDLILESPDKMTTTQIAFDYGMGAPTFNKLLASLKIQRKVNGQWILYRQYMGKGYTKTETFPITHRDGRRGTTTNTVWTQKGREFLYRKLKKNGYLPLVEQDDLAS